MNELLETKVVAPYEGTQVATVSSELMQKDHVVICGLCGAVERPIGPHKTECPNCDDYIY